MVIADLDGDGDSDIATANAIGTHPFSGSTSILLNDGCPCFGDVDGSGDVGSGDLLSILSHWDPCPGGVDPCPADIEPPGSDGDVGFADLLGVLNDWGPCP